MPKVLHVGPCDTPGGMATVMHTLAEYPPEGWEAELLASHAPGGLWAKWRAYRRARKELIRRCQSPQDRPDIVHVHTAADWSWKRKRRFAQMAKKAGISNIIHLHSGQFDTWLKAHPQRCVRFNEDIRENNSTVVVLSNSWKEKLSALIHVDYAVNNPFKPPLDQHSRTARDPNKILFLARNDPIKGGLFAQHLVEEVREEYPNVFLSMSGILGQTPDWVKALGWMSEDEKRNHLSSALVVLVPSAFEGQPMVALEALSMGTPVIVSDTIHSLPEGVPQAKFENIEDWLSHLRPIIAARGDFNLKIGLDEYSLHAVQNQWKSIYSSIIE